MTTLSAEPLAELEASCKERNVLGSQTILMLIARIRELEAELSRRPSAEAIQWGADQKPEIDRLRQTMTFKPLDEVRFKDRAIAAESALAAARAEMKRALDHYDMRLEIYTNDADCAGGMADILRAALTETGHDR